MKVALCLSGQAREFDEGYKYFHKYILNIYQVDTFIHTWITSEKSDLKIKLNNEQVDKYIELLKPKAFLVEEYTKEKKSQIFRETQMDVFQNFVKTSLLPSCIERNGSVCEICGNKTVPDEGKLICRACGGRHVHNYLAKLYSIYQANKLRGQGYDVVIQTRPDVKLLQSIDLEKVLPFYLPRTIVDRDKWSCVSKEKRRLPDLILISNEEYANIYADLYLNIKKMSEETAKWAYGTAYSHTCLVTWLEKNNITITSLPVLDHILVRRMRERPNQKSNIPKTVYKRVEDLAEFLIVEIVLPGMTLAQLDISWENDKLKIRKKQQEEGSIGYFFDVEDISLPVNLFDIDHINFNMAHGVLGISVPRREKPLYLAKNFELVAE